MQSLTTTHNYHDWLTSMALPFLGEHAIEMGSGLGDYAEQWLASGVPELTVSEVDPTRLAVLEEEIRR